jgi:hypothetical protein
MFIGGSGLWVEGERRSAAIAGVEIMGAAERALTGPNDKGLITGLTPCPVDHNVPDNQRSQER